MDYREILWKSGKFSKRIGTMSNDGVCVKAINHVKLDVIDEAPDGYLHVYPVILTRVFYAGTTAAAHLWLISSHCFRLLRPESDTAK